MDTKQKNPRQTEPRGTKAPVPETREPVKRKRPAGAAAAPEQKRTAASRRGEAPARKAAPDQKPVQRKRPAPAAEKAPEQKKKTARPAEKDGGRTAVRTEAKPRQRKPAKQAEEPAYTHGLPDSVSTKKRSYGNSKPKKKGVRDLINDAIKQAGERKTERIKKRQTKMEQGSHAKDRPQMNTPAVIYTEPQAFNRNRFFMQMITVVAVVIALVMGLSVFFKVEHVTVSGAEVYSAWAVRDASGIQTGDNLLTFSHARAGAKIKATLPYVKTVRFGIKLPDTVNIIIEEEDVVYAIKNQDGAWWLMTSSGRMVEQSNDTKAANYTQILGVTVTDPIANERGIATESAVVYETNAQGETEPIPVSVTGAQRLNTALQIVKALEDNDIVGAAASVDVTSMEYIVLMYGNRFQVNLGDSANIAYKINCMNDVILQMEDYQTGVLDISFTIWPNQVGYTPFS